MNKQGYLNELEKALRVAHVRDYEDILEEYAEHFDMKMRDGYGEEEVAARLASPQDVADQFAGLKPAGDVGKGAKIVVATGLVFADTFVGAFFAALYAWVASLGIFTVASAGLGIALVTRVSLWGIIPNMPYICALLIGLGLLGLAVLSAVGTEYCRLYVTQLVKVYIRWHKAVLGDNGRALPPLSMHPQIKPKKRRVMRRTALVSLAVVAVCLVAGMGSMMILAGALEPWHVWHWFE